MKRISPDLCRDAWRNSSYIGPVALDIYPSNRTVPDTPGLSDFELAMRHTDFVAGFEYVKKKKGRCANTSLSAALSRNNTTLGKSSHHHTRASGRWAVAGFPNLQQVPHHAKHPGKHPHG